MLFTDQTESAVRLSLKRGDATGGGTDAVDARRVIEYYRDIAYHEKDLYAKFLPLFANRDKWYSRPKACYNLTAGIVDAVSTLYHDPVVYTFEDELAESYWEQIEGWASLMADVDRYTFLGGTLGVRPIVRDGVVDWHVYVADQIEYIQTPEDATRAQQITVRWRNGQGLSTSETAHHWTDEQFAETVDDTLTGGVQDNPYKVIPITMFRNECERWGFFGEPARDLAAANLALNACMTDLNHTVRWQSHGQLVIVGAPVDYKPPIGADTYISVSNAPNSTGADARYINPGADVAAIINAVNQNLDMIFSARRIPKSAVVAVQGDSGVSLVAQQEALRDYRKRRISVMQPQEQALISMTLKVMHFHATGELRDFEPPQITYTKLEAPMADDARLDWDWKLRLGIVSPVDVMMALNPGMKREEAEERLAENRELRRQEFSDQLAVRRPAGAVPELEDEEDEAEEEEAE